MSRAWRLGFLAACALTVAPRVASAETPRWLRWTLAGPDDALALTIPADLVVTGAGFALWGGTQLLRSDIGPKACTWCDGVDNVGLPSTPGNGRGSLNAVDAYFHDALTGWLMRRKTADSLSSGLAYGAAPAFALGGALFATGDHASSGAGARQAVIVLESVALSGVVGQALKFGIARKRPFVRYGHGTAGSTPDEGSTYDVTDPDSSFSFVSGHSSATAALVVSTAMCATLQDSKAAPALWIGAGSLILATGTLRMVAEKHYFTDVLGGAILGSGAGVLVPLLHRRGSWLGTSFASVQFAWTDGAPTLGVAGTF